jgi:hypothetical protein
MTLAPIDPPPNAEIRELGYLYGDGHSRSIAYKTIIQKDHYSPDYKSKRLGLAVGVAMWNWTIELWIWSDYPEIATSTQLFYRNEKRALEAMEVFVRRLSQKADNYKYRGV